MQIEPLDFDDAETMAGLAALNRAHLSHDRPDYPILSDAAFFAAISGAHADTDIEHWIARDTDDTVVGFIDLVLPRTVNREHIHTMGYVHPRHRRRGIGTALFRKLEQRGRALGRHKVTASAWEPASENDSIVVDGGAQFLRAMGMRRVLVEQRRRLDLTVLDLAALDAVAAAEHGGDYELAVWIDRAPDDWAPGVAALEQVLEEDVPIGESDWEPLNYDVTAWRAKEDRAIERRRTSYYAAARHRATGDPAALTGLFLPEAPRTHAVQTSTVVARGHRGHRLGFAVKHANLRQLVAHEPDARYVDTFNAVDNSHMIAVNDRFGFELRNVESDFQGTIPH